MKNQQLTKTQAIEVVDQSPYVHVVAKELSIEMGSYYSHEEIAVLLEKHEDDIFIADREWIEKGHAIEVKGGNFSWLIETDKSKFAALYPEASL